MHRVGSVPSERGLRSPTAGLLRDAAALGHLPWVVIAQDDDAGANTDHVADQGSTSVLCDILALDRQKAV